jgi:hypothetical protein
LVAGPSIDSKTISLWLQIAFAAGYYTVGGVPAGVAAYAVGQTVDSAQFLAAYVGTEATRTSSPAVGSYRYLYIPSTDKFQIFDSSNAELGASAAIPAGVLNDTIVGQFIYNRL